MRRQKWRFEKLSGLGFMLENTKTLLMVQMNKKIYKIESGEDNFLSKLVSFFSLKIDPYYIKDTEAVGSDDELDHTYRRFQVEIEVSNRLRLDLMLAHTTRR